MSFLPEGYQKPQTASKYMKLEEGDNKFRILSKSIVGYVDWAEDKKPVRTKELMKAINPAKRPKHFWAFIVWDYQDESIKILELTQSTVQTAIIDLYMDVNWGEPMNYDLNVKRTGKDMETKYTVIPMPPKPVDKTITDLYVSTPIDLEELFVGGDPFATKEDSPVVDSQPSIDELAKADPEYFNPQNSASEVDVSKIPV